MGASTVTTRASIVSRLTGQVREVQDRLRPTIERAAELRASLRSACSDLDRSWSQSWIGYHALTYYGDFEPPLAGHMWNPEWGARHSNDAWRERQPEDVRAAIEKIAGTTVVELGDLMNLIRDELHPLLDDLVVELGPICDGAGFERERVLLDEVEKGLVWKGSVEEYVLVRMPKQYMSRDSTAMNQGAVCPAHTHYEASVLATSVPLHVAEDVLPKANRLLRQVQSKLASSSADAATDKRASSVQKPHAPVAAPHGHNWERRAKLTGFVLFFVVGAAFATVSVWAMRRLDPAVIVQSIAYVACALVIAGTYAVLVDRQHAKAAVAASVLVLGAVASVYQLLAPFP